MLKMKSGQVIPYTDTCNYLGNTICSYNENVIIDNAIPDMNMRLNNLLSEFSHCESGTLSTLFRTYCTNRYWCQTWRYNGNYFDKLYSTWITYSLLCMYLSATCYPVIFYPLHLYVFVLICQYYVVLLERTNKDIIYRECTNNSRNVRNKSRRHGKRVWCNRECELLCKECMTIKNSLKYVCNPHYQLFPEHVKQYKQKVVSKTKKLYTRKFHIRKLKAQNPTEFWKKIKIKPTPNNHNLMPYYLLGLLITFMN